MLDEPRDDVAFDVDEQGALDVDDAPRPVRAGASASSAKTREAAYAM
ncbi:hypothetical protein [Nocardioides sp. B-3]|nr:hypothetical protein [Nocardioides sp. B-3]UUZ60587.1 hypothetical protein LP418_06895 [Nocardioides sp. B-3]